VSTPAPALTRYALLRGDGDWPHAVLDRLELTDDGALQLRSVPLVSPPSLAAAGWVEFPSGLALDRSCGLYVVDSVARQLERVALDCAGEVRVIEAGPDAGAGRLSRPAGACVGPFGWLFVADQAGWVLVFATPRLTLRDVWTQGLRSPVAVAPAGPCGVYVLDGAGEERALRRFDAWGAPDTVWNARIAPPAGPRFPQAIAAAEDGTLFVADFGGGVRRYSADATEIAPALITGARVGALAYAAGILYAADEATGEIVLVDVDSAAVLGSVAGFRGPVAALAAAACGDLYIKPERGAYLVARAGAGRAAIGTATAGPLDAGEQQVWARLAASACAAPGTSVTVETATADASTVPPDWVMAPANDSLVSPRRYLWARVTLAQDPTAAPDATPTVDQVAGGTSAESYLPYLPAVYARSASPLLEGLLGLAKAELGDLENAIASLHTLYDPTATPVEVLAWLAAWQALPLPDGSGPRTERAMIEGLAELYPRRGTLAGVRRAIELYAGVTASIFEQFRARGIWCLDATSALGFDTQLLSSAVDGLVVDDAVLGATGPQDASQWGSALFAPTAHRFTVLVAASDATAGTVKAAIERTLAAEAPAHAEYHVCLATARMRVGVQARVGVDAIVAREESLVLGERSILNVTARTARDGEPGAIGRRGRLGTETVIG
jgi:phage tail-like protein